MEDSRAFITIQAVSLSQAFNDLEDIFGKDWVKSNLSKFKVQLSLYVDDSKPFNNE